MSIKNIFIAIWTGLCAIFSAIFYVLFKEAKEQREQEEREKIQAEKLAAKTIKDAEQAQEQLKQELTRQNAADEAKKVYNKEIKEYEELRNDNHGTINNFNNRLQHLSERSKSRSTD